MENASSKPFFFFKWASVFGLREVSLEGVYTRLDPVTEPFTPWCRSHQGYALRKCNGKEETLRTVTHQHQSGSFKKSLQTIINGLEIILKQH